MRKQNRPGLNPRQAQLFEAMERGEEQSCSDKSISKEETWPNEVSQSSKGQYFRKEDVAIFNNF